MNLLNCFFCRRLDQSYGYPPNSVVEKFQQRLKAIKTFDRYSDLVKAIKLDYKIKTPEDLINLLKRSIYISNKQGYTDIISDAEAQERRFNERAQYNKQQQRHYSGKDKR
jgi:hypothetical protein